MKSLRCLAPTVALVLVAGLAMSPAAPAHAAPSTAPAATQPAEATLQIYSVRVTRGGGSRNQEMQKRFAGRYYMENSPGVVLQLLLTLKDTTVLPFTREALNIDTFVDDTYENLLSGPNENRYSGNPPAVSVDGQQVMFTIGSSRAPSDEAGRVFVRGHLQARVTRGESKVSSAALNLKAGAAVDVGPFRTTLRSISDAGQNLSLQLAVVGDAGRIRQVRLLSKDGRRLNNDELQNRFIDQGGARGEQQTVFHANIPPAQEEITIEFMHAEKVEDVRIPFEAQVDLGQTKAGPLESIAPAKPGGASGDRKVRERPWPPPPPQASAAGGVEFAAPRPFDPAVGPTAATSPVEKAKLDKAAVDVFSLTVAKPAPDEVEGVKWANPPAPVFRAAGFTIARLMLSTPDLSILSVPADGIDISRFEDDKGKKDTAVYRDQTYGFRGERAFVSPDGQQALVNVAMASPPSPGATRCTLAGTVKARVARGDKTDASDAIPLSRGQQVKVGPVDVRIADIRQQPPMSPAGMNRLQYEVRLNVSGKLENVRSVELINAASGQPLFPRYPFNAYEEGRSLGDNMSFGIAFDQTPPEKVIIRVRHFDKAETVTVPFEVTTGIGLGG